MPLLIYRCRGRKVILNLYGERSQVKQRRSDPPEVFMNGDIRKIDYP